jgi:DNA-binding transcriptional MerR regulator
MTDDLKYSAKQIADLTGMPVSKLGYLEKYGVITPTRVKSGRGKAAKEVVLYTAKDLETIELIWKIDRLLAPKGLKRAIDLGKLEEIVTILG